MLLVHGYFAAKEGRKQQSCPESYGGQIHQIPVVGLLGVLQVKGENLIPLAGGLSVVRQSFFAVGEEEDAVLLVSLVLAPIPAASAKLQRVDFLICQSFVAVGEENDTAVGEAVLEDIVLHDAVVAVGVDTDVAVAGEGELHDGVEDAVCFRHAGDAVDDMVGQGVVEPLTVVDGGVGGFGRGQEGEVGHDAAVVFHHEAAVSFYIGLHHLQRRVAVDPLFRIAVGHHDTLGGCENLKDFLSVIGQTGGADGEGVHYFDGKVLILSRKSFSTWLNVSWCIGIVS